MRASTEFTADIQESIGWVAHRSDPQQTLDLLLQQKSFDTAKQWIRLHDLGQNALLVSHAVKLMLFTVDVQHRFCSVESGRTIFD